MPPSHPVKSCGEKDLAFSPGLFEIIPGIPGIEVKRLISLGGLVIALTVDGPYVLGNERFEPCSDLAPYLPSV